MVKSGRTLNLLAMLLAAHASAMAHRLDECLQATRISIFPDHLAIQTYITPGTLLAPGFFARIDANRDGAISEAEGRDYAEKTLQRITLSVDGLRVPLTLTGSQYPTFSELSGGEAMIRLEMLATTPEVPGRHRLLLQNDNDPAISIYLANAMLPRDPSISIVSQNRDQRQQTLTVEYDLKPSTNATIDAFGGWTGRLMGICLGLGVVFLARVYLHRRLTFEGGLARPPEPGQTSAGWRDSSAKPSISSGKAK